MNPDDLYSKGMNLLEERKFQNALSHFEQALIENPNNPDILNGSWKRYQPEGKYEKVSDNGNVLSYVSIIKIIPAKYEASTRLARM